ncbi:DUF3857 domain-containing protein [Flavobacterium sp.]|uniref:DUF3857 and transglutaminase domain-containing protein n=1 Tax=Flavobacterium sp. TaxID=239 RepID=UPI002633BD70|nr:DUF3857 domain-containing protein [Flavobacterium sp.]
MRLKYYVLLHILLSAFAANSQDFKLGRVSIEELQQQKHPLEPSAPAAILNKAGYTYFVVNSGIWTMVTEVEMRIKIYNKSGVEYATHELGYLSESKKMSVNYSNAATYNLVDGKVNKTSVNKEGKFKEELNEKVSIKKITFPDVKDGSVIEFKYTIRTPFIFSFRDWYFQYEIPVNNMSYKVAIPSCFVYQRYIKGYIKDVKASEPKMVLGKTIYNDVTVTYTATDIKPVKEEPFIDNIDNYRAAIAYELEYIRYEGEPEKHFSSTWGDVAKEIYKDDDFGKELGRTGYFKDDLDALLAGINTVTEKTNAIFLYVQKRMMWNEDSRYYCDKGVKEAYQEKTGNSAEINFILIAMLRSAGIDANPVLVSTRDNGISLYPGMSGFNYVVAAAEIGGKTVLLDATSKYNCPGILPERALNWYGTLIRENGTYKEIDLKPEKKSLEAATLSAVVDDKGNITGRVRSQYTNQSALNYREEHSSEKSINRIAEIERKYNNLLVSDFLLKETSNLSEPVIEDYSFTYNNAAEIIGDRMYLNPLLFMTAQENPLKQEKREYPVSFVYPKLYKNIFIITLPDGYEIESLPKSVAIAMEEGIGDMAYSIAAKDNVVQVAMQLNINYSLVSQLYYDTIRNFYKNVIEKQNEKIVLKRI